MMWLLTAREQDDCTPSTEQLEAYLDEPDDAVARSLNIRDKRLVAKCVLYGENIARAQLKEVCFILTGMCVEGIPLADWNALLDESGIGHYED